MRDNILYLDSFCPECKEPVCTPITYFGHLIYLDIYNGIIHKCRDHDDFCMCQICWLARHIFLNRDELYLNYPECFTPLAHEAWRLYRLDTTKTFTYFIDYYKSEQPQEVIDGVNLFKQFS